MNVIILHGDDTVKLYARLTKFNTEAKKRGWKVTDFNMSEVENQSLFGEECFFILKDYKSLTKKDIEKLEKYTGNLVIYHEGKIPALAIKQFKSSKIELFELPQLLWKFLDSLDNINSSTVKLFHDLIKTQPVEFVLAMIAWKLRKKYIANQNANVAQMITELSEIDVNVKTSKVNLIDALDLLITKHLQ